MRGFIEDYFSCERCLWIALKKSKRLNKYAEKTHYSLHENSIENKGYVAMFEAFLDFIETHVKTYSDVLEFGCGPEPVLAQLLEQKHKHVTCHDPYFLPNPHWEKYQYDLITCTEVFEHLADPLDVLTSLKQRLTPEGHLALMTHFHHNNPTQFATWFYKKDPTHIGFFTPKTFELMAAKLGLHVKAHDGKKCILLGRAQVECA
jgi:SAM-dependent methyltransferase